MLVGYNDLGTHGVNAIDLLLTSVNHWSGLIMLFLNGLQSARRSHPFGGNAFDLSLKSCRPLVRSAVIKLLSLLWGELLILYLESDPSFGFWSCNLVLSKAISLVLSKFVQSYNSSNHRFTENLFGRISFLPNLQLPNLRFYQIYDSQKIPNLTLTNLT